MADHADIQRYRRNLRDEDDGAALYAALAADDQRLAPARKDEEVEFGTLVFFNGLRHVGIVADEHGFYHASRTNGVAYSPFNQYWLDRIDGFRRIPLQSAIPGAE